MQTNTFEAPSRKSDHRLIASNTNIGSALDNTLNNHDSGRSVLLVDSGSELSKG